MLPESTTFECFQIGPGREDPEAGAKLAEHDEEPAVGANELNAQIEQPAAFVVPGFVTVPA